ncbi:MAG: hypothetical protein IT537_01795 [Hyphomicrobiales bacterium]|nr:hypothetical protein [Hyphomicrobiales bacterium]
MKPKFVGLLAGIVLLGVSPASAITYNVNIPVGAGNVSGFIETDGSIGTLTAADIVDWNLLIDSGTLSTTLTGPLSGSNSTVGFFGSPAFTASATQLLFDFSASTIEVDYVIFQKPSFGDFFCINACASQFAVGVGGERAFGIADGVVEIGSVSAVPVPAALPLFVSGVGILGLAGWRRKRKHQISAGV